MSLQVFLQAKLTGIEQFLRFSTSETDDTAIMTGRCAWASLIPEVLPRALLAQFKLSRMLLGSSGGEQFLLVLPDESVNEANEFLISAREAIARLTGNTVQLVWAHTENLGTWPIARKRLDDELQLKSATPLAAGPGDLFQPLTAGQSRQPSVPETDEIQPLPELPVSREPFTQQSVHPDDGWFAEFGSKIGTATSVGWSADEPAKILCDGGAFSWKLADQSNPEEDTITFPRRCAMQEDGTTPASVAELAALAEGSPRWAVLRGDVDHFDTRLRRADSVEEHILLSVLYKEFFSGELSVLCTLPEFWRKVTILYRGGDDFAVYGAWDALIAFAREIERVFERFAEQNLQSFAGIEGKSLSMSLALAGEEARLSTVFADAGTQLEAAKSVEKGTFYLFGRTLDWKRLPDAEELKTGLVRLVKDFGYSPDYIHDLVAVYREAYSAQATRKNKSIRVDKPWRTYMRLSQVIPPARGRELTALRNNLIVNLIGKKTANLKLRPSARVGLEWARLAAGSETEKGVVAAGGAVETVPGSGQQEEVSIDGIQ